MTIYNILNEVIVLFVAFGVNLIVHFDEPVMAAGANSNFQIEATNDNKTFVITSTKKGAFNSNIVFFNEKEKFNIALVQDGKQTHDFINIRKGEIGNSFTLRLENDEFRVLDSSKSSLIESKGEVLVNGKQIKGSVHVSKGAPVYVKTSKETYLINHGRRL